jgi:hypothetical protein
MEGMTPKCNQPLMLQLTADSALNLAEHEYHGPVYNWNPANRLIIDWMLNIVCPGKTRNKNKQVKQQETNKKLYWSNINQTSWEDNPSNRTHTKSMH